MPVIVVTRLRLKDPALLDEFFTDAVAAIEQAQKSDGNLGADALADANNAWWSVSSWQARGPMRAFVRSEPHRSITARLDHYCDEATFVDWEQDSPDLPDWQTNWRPAPRRRAPPPARRPRPHGGRASASPPHHSVTTRESRSRRQSSVSTRKKASRVSTRANSKP